MILAGRCEQLDLFYMVGLPGQTHGSVLATVDAIAALFARFDGRLSAFLTPMGLFIDPGSDGFEQAEARGYRIRARTLGEHRALLEKRDWESILNYETRWMTRAEIVDATYEAAERLNGLKARTGRIPRKRAEGVAARLAAARSLRGRIAAAGEGGLDTATHRALLGEIRAFSESTLNDKTELFPPGTFLRNFRLGGIARLLVHEMIRSAGPIVAPSSGSSSSRAQEARASAIRHARFAGQPSAAAADRTESRGESIRFRSMEAAPPLLQEDAEPHGTIPPGYFGRPRPGGTVDLNEESGREFFAGATPWTVPASRNSVPRAMHRLKPGWSVAAEDFRGSGPGEDAFPGPSPLFTRADFRWKVGVPRGAFAMRFECREHAGRLPGDEMAGFLEAPVCRRGHLFGRCRQDPHDHPFATAPLRRLQSVRPERGCATSSAFRRAARNVAPMKGHSSARCCGASRPEGGTS